MNILFVLYNDFKANSAPHVQALAEELMKLGHDCCVAVPDNKISISVLGSVTFSCIEFSEYSCLKTIFSNGLPPDVVHAWTPREIVRRFCQAVCIEFSCRLFVHLEDNEWHILSCALGCTMKDLDRLSDEALDERISLGLSHPRKVTSFLGSADGVTIIIDRLAEFVPVRVPVLEMWPSADLRTFRPMVKDSHRRRVLGIAENSTVIVYTGNVHAANAHEVRSLYLAVAILNREGVPATLVRAGRDYYPFLGPNEDWGRSNAVELGFVAHVDICAVLALADVLVQPGKADAFNDFRFPSKLPEFMSVGRPVILPNTNIGKRMMHRRHAYLLADPSAISIADAIREIMSDKALYDILSTGSLEFCRQHLSWQQSAHKLHNFYSSTMPVRQLAATA